MQKNIYILQFSEKKKKTLKKLSIYLNLLVYPWIYSVRVGKKLETLLLKKGIGAEGLGLLPPESKSSIPSQMHV